MLTTVIVFAVIAVVFELSIVSRVAALRQTMSRHPLAGVAFSIGLSLLLGALFGAAGVMLLMAGVISTVITGIIYALWGKVGNKTSQAAQWWADTKAAYRPLLKFIKYTAIVLTSPLWIPVVIHRKINGTTTTA